MFGVAGFLERVEAATTPFVAENEHLRVEFDPETGHLLRLQHVKTGLELLGGPVHRSTPPWILFIGESDQRFAEFHTFTATPLGGARGYDLHWQGGAYDVRVRLELDGDTLHLWPAVENRGSDEIAGLVYPNLANVAALSRPGNNDRLAHPFATGFLFHNPALLFQVAPYGIPHAPYPSGEGASMQFMAYYVDQVGGFYFATHDPYKTAKELNVTRSSVRNRLQISFVHRNWDMQAGGAFNPGYAVEISALGSGGWEEAADRYRNWALQMPWARRGSLAERLDQAARGEPALVAPWLLQEVGLTTFGAKGAVPSPDAFDRWSRLVRQPVLHVYYGEPIPDGTRLHPANRDVVRQHGGYLSSFENDIIVPVYASDHRPDAALVPRLDAAWGSWRATWMDPTSPYIRNRQARRAERLLTAYGVDAFYYDISTSFAPMRSFSQTSGNPRGYGRWLVDGYLDFHRHVRAAAAALPAAQGKYIPMGTEGIHELAIEVLDFYQARANAFPASHPFEGSQFNPYRLNAAADRIPLFEYVYHEVGPVRMDGWGQLSEAEGDYMYPVAARTVLWGGLYQLNFEFRTMAGEPGDAKLQFLQDLATARTEYGNRYLALGRMEPAPRIDAPAVSYSYRVENLPGGAQPATGRQQAPGVISSAWRSPEGSLGFFFANVQADAWTLDWTFHPEAYGWSGQAPYVATWWGGDGPEAGVEAKGALAVQRVLEPRRVVMLQLRPVSDVE